MARRRLSIVVVEEHENGDEGVSKPIDISLAKARLLLAKKPPPTMSKSERDSYDEEGLRARELSNLADALWEDLRRKFATPKRKK